MIIIDLQDATEYERNEYGILYTSATAHKVTGPGVHNRSFHHQLKVWTNKDGGERAQYVGCLYRDPRGNFTNAERSYLLSAQPSVISARPTGAELAYGETLEIGATVRLRFPDGTISGEMLIRAGKLADPFLEPVGGEITPEIAVNMPVRHDRLTPMMEAGLRAIAEGDTEHYLTVNTAAALVSRRMITPGTRYTHKLMNAGRDWLAGADPAPRRSVQRMLAAIGVKVSHVRMRPGWRLTDFGVGSIITADFDNEREARDAIDALELHMIGLGYIIQRRAGSDRIVVLGRR